jgi:acid phosphatase (class A)
MYLLGAGAGVLVVAGAATLAAQWTQAKAPDAEHFTYLGGTAAQLAAGVPSPPRAPNVVLADRQVFRSTRRLQGSARWKLAAEDANQAAPALLKDFSCSSGLNLSAAQAPHLASLLADAGADAAHVASRAKSRFGRRRPYVLDPGPTCRPTRGLGDFHDYPSGHSTRGWTWGLILAELLPDRRQFLMSRAQAYADSRVVCGFHTPTGAAAGRGVATLAVVALKRDPRFRAELKQASNELAALKQQGDAPPAGQCRSEQAMLQRPY